MHRSVGSPVIKNDLLAICDFSGLVHCLNAKTGVPYWTYDVLAATWTTTMIAEEKIYVVDEDGDVAIFQLSPKLSDSLNPDQSLKHDVNVENSVYSAPVVANNRLYVTNRTHIFAIGKQETDKP